MWLINTHNGYFDKKSGKKVPPINITDYPVIKERLDKYWKKIEKRQDKGVTPYNLRNCAYLGEFEKEKIVYPDIAEKLTFILDNKNMFMNNTCYFLNFTNRNRSVLPMISSRLINWYFKFISAQLGEKGVRHFNIYIEQLPIPRISHQSQLPFITLTNIIITKKEKGKDTTTEENKIDIMVYKLYGLTYDEVKIIDPGIEKIISKEKYNAKKLRKSPKRKPRVKLFIG